ncbi:MAG TPA: peptidase dimerization domain-containing protein [Variovorax sp.]|nr:peptidase dimerization domain-containing protein [Variovorax sp.]
MKKTIASLMCLAVLGLTSTHVAAQQTSRLLVEFQGPGGHSNADYGRTSALHAAGRSIERLQSAGLPSGSYQLTGLSGGNSVNSLASRARYEVLLTAADATALQALVVQVTATVKTGVDAENTFRGVKEGDLVAGAPANIRYTVTPQ